MARLCGLLSKGYSERNRVGNRVVGPAEVLAEGSGSTSVLNH